MSQTISVIDRSGTCYFYMHQTSGKYAGNKLKKQKPAFSGPITCNKAFNLVQTTHNALPINHASSSLSFFPTNSVVAGCALCKEVIK